MADDLRDHLIKEFTALKDIERQAHDYYTDHLDLIKDKKLRGVVSDIAQEELHHESIAGELIKLAKSLPAGEATADVEGAGEAMTAIEEATEDLDSPLTLLVQTSLENYPRTCQALITYFRRQDRPVRYVSVNKPASKLKRILKKRGAEVDDVSFIDPVTSTSGIMLDPKNLTTLSVLFTRNSGEDMVVIVDSLSVLSVYHSKDILQRFVHSTTMGAKMRGVDLVFLTMDAESDIGNDPSFEAFFDDVAKV
ncbi:MAG: hypothetical protein QF415_13615 [Candidatus Undinarchaeales archaeon]|jgi:hypothetical protein|nr:hypothetical protein [Candidatus Undinarchaeales archaeon]MDP7494301.1 hypothetical protein [Candidatus Undinarchaeales archaeon]